MYISDFNQSTIQYSCHLMLSVIIIPPSIRLDTVGYWSPSKIGKFFLEIHDWQTYDYYLGIWS